MFKRDKYAKEKERFEIISILINDYERTKPTKQQVDDYKLELSRLKLKELKTLLQPLQPKGKLKILDRMFFILSKKKRLLVTFYNTNGTVSNYCIHKKGRTFKLDNCTYCIHMETARLHVTYKIMNLVYMEGIPLPVDIHAQKDKVSLQVVDSAVLTKILRMEYVSMLAQVGKVKDALNIILILAGVSALASVVTVIMQSGCWSGL